MNYAETIEMLHEKAQIHQRHDAIVQGMHWDGEKGCCVGCLAETDKEPHEALSSLTGVPKWVFQLADTLHERLSAEDAKRWPVRFTAALQHTSEMTKWRQIETQFKIYLLHDCLSHKKVWLKQDQKSKYAQQVIAATEQMITALESNDQDKIDLAEEAAYAAWRAADAEISAANSTRSAAWSAANSARSAARSAAWSAANSAKSAAWRAADAAWSATRSAAWSASNSARSATWSAAKKIAAKRYTDKFCEIMRAMNL